jgi:hypothetical protein
MKRKFIFKLLLFFLCIGSVPVLAQEEVPVYIHSPVAGQSLSGAVAITGTSQVDGFLYYEVAFTYASEEADTWFLISSSDQPVSDGELAIWETTPLVNGLYHLRLRVYLQDGTFLEAVVEDLEVGDSFVATPTTVPVTSMPATILPTQPVSVVTPTVTASPYPTPSPIATNPVVVREDQVYSNLGLGGLIALIAFIFFGLIVCFRRKF